MNNSHNKTTSIMPSNLKPKQNENYKKDQPLKSPQQNTYLHSLLIHPLSHIQISFAKLLQIKHNNYQVWKRYFRVNRGGKLSF
jgi:hypothetical protein